MVGASAAEIAAIVQQHYGTACSADTLAIAEPLRCTLKINRLPPTSPGPLPAGTTQHDVVHPAGPA
jgi:hypothetical protein